MNKTSALALALVAAALLAACSDDSPSDPPPVAVEVPEVIPASATVSTAAFVDYTAKLPVSDVKEPVDLLTAMPPTSETEEPFAVN